MNQETRESQQRKTPEELVQSLVEWVKNPGRELEIVTELADNNAFRSWLPNRIKEIRIQAETKPESERDAFIEEECQKIYNEMDEPKQETM